MEGQGWSGTCPRDSLLYLNPKDWFQEPIPQNSKTFIYDHRGSMDPCNNPELVLLHGTYLAHGIGPPLERFPSPLFSPSSTLLHMDILMTSMSQSSPLFEDDITWEQKTDGRLFWRGSTTGIYHHKGVDWRKSQRIRLVNLTGPRSASHVADDAIVSFLNPDAPPDESVGNPVEHSRRQVNSALMDIGFAGSPIQCEADTCEIMSKELDWLDRVSMDADGAGRYKFILDVDGNGWSQRFRRLMSSHSAVFKSTIYPEWWTDRAQAWVHYIPVQVDYSDLYDTVSFFAGNPPGKGGHDQMAKKIAEAGREWAEKFWRKEDVVAYMFRFVRSL